MAITHEILQKRYIKELDSLIDHQTIHEIQNCYQLFFFTLKAKRIRDFPDLSAKVNKLGYIIHSIEAGGPLDSQNAANLYITVERVNKQK